jgi:hypothetical protein
LRRSRARKEECFAALELLRRMTSVGDISNPYEVGRRNEQP